MDGPVSQIQNIHLGFGSSDVPSREGPSPFDSLSPSAPGRLKQVWAIGGGKGGVGKSLIASSIAIALSQTGNRVTAIDLDLGGANLHTALGVDLPRQTLSDFFAHRVPLLDQCAVPSGIPNLDLISGAQDDVGVANLGFNEKVRLMQRLREMNTDYVIIDLGAGTTDNTIDFFLSADIGIMALLPEPTSIENGYRFIKSAYYRRLMHSRSLREIRPLLEMAMDAKNAKGIRSPSDLYREVNQNNPEAALRLKQEIEKFRPKLIINQARTQTDIDIGFSVRAVCKKYFGIEIDYLGHLDYDSAVWQAVRRKRPLMTEFPTSRLVASIERLVQQLLRNHSAQKNNLFP